MSYSAVPTNYDYDHGDISQPVPIFPSQEQTQYSPEKQSFLVHERSDSESQKPSSTNSRHGRRSALEVIKFILIQILAFLWIAPIVALLYFNFTNWVIGASAWCPFGHCRPHQYGGDQDTLMLLAEFDHDSHNLLGALQFAAKALEVWFVLVASALVFRVTMILVHMKDGLPIGYLYRPLEYAEVTSLINPETYMPLHRMLPRAGGHVKKRVAVFIAMTIFLCIICNLMGPAVAVLLIPQLQWIDTQRVGNETLQGLNSGSPPGVGGFAFRDSECSGERFNAQQYSCAGTWPNGVDGWVQSYQSSQNSDSSIFSVQDLLTISYNTTAAWFNDSTWETMYFVPSRQVVHNLTNDLYTVGDIDNDKTGADVDGSYTEYTRTVQSYIHRQSPLLGAVVNLWADFDESNHWWTTIDDAQDQYLRCYGSYNMSNTPLCWDDSCNTLKTGNYTRCIKVGSGWNEEAKYSNLTITPQLSQDINSFNGTWTPALYVDIYTSSQVAFLPNGTLPKGFSDDCLPVNGTIPSGTQCDWDVLFATGDEPNVARHSKEVTTWEVNTQWQEVSESAGRVTLAVDFSVYQALADYSFDPSTFTNPALAVDTRLLINKDEWVPNNMTVLPVDPAWSLAAFAVDQYGVMDNDRPVAKWLSHYIDVLGYSYEEEDFWYPVSGGVEGPTLMPVIQLMSLIDFNTTVVDLKTVKDDPAHPLLSRWAHIDVWAYSTDSRTSKLGYIVAIIGCLVVLAKVLLSLAVPKDFPGPLELLIAALEHRYTGEFRGHEEKEFASLPFILQPDEGAVGGYRFGKRD